MADRTPMAQTLLTRLLVGFALVSLGFAAGKHWARPGGDERAPSSGPADHSEDAPVPAVTVTYMHATFRCITCNTIERMTRELLETDFASELKAGAVRLLAVDFQKNEPLARRYGVATSCIVVARGRGGAEAAFERLDDVWTLMDDPPAFDRYVGDVIRGYLADARAD